jgi:hypothetical protein
MDKKYGHTVFPECLHELSCIPDDLLCRIRLRGLCPDSLLQVNDDKGRCCFMDFQFWYGIIMWIGFGVLFITSDRTNEELYQTQESGRRIAAQFFSSLRS